MKYYYTIAERIGGHANYQKAWATLGDLVEPVDIKIGKFAAIPIKTYEGKYYYFYVHRPTKDHYDTYVSYQDAYFDNFNDANNLLRWHDANKKICQISHDCQKHI